ncbi:MAG: tetratricopeptide repeat protein [Candidatus Sumerlaeia bacterium]|nr:tetratricopeptide repeat protein [Candidatus Sumerlaeia bacterium]
MGDSKTPPPLIGDLRRMAPVWGIVCVTAIAAVFSMRAIGERHLRAAVESSSNACEYAQIYMARGLVLMERIRGDAAPIIIESIRPGDPSLGVLAGDPLLAEAREAYTRVREICPIEVEASMQLAVIEWYDGNETASYLHLGDYLLSMGRLEEAIVSYEVTMERDPESVEARIGLTTALVDGGRPQEALAVVEDYRAHFMESARGRFALGYLEAAVGSTEIAVEHLKAGLLETPSEIKAIRLLYRLAMGTDSGPDVAGFLHRLGETGKRTHIEGFHVASLLFSEVGDYENAEHALRRALALGPNQVVLHFDHAVALHRLGRRSAARDAIRRALEIDSSRVIAMIEDSGVDPR